MTIHTHGADKASWQVLQKDQDLKHLKSKDNPEDDIEPVLLDM